MFSIKNKVALITGASNGIGLAIAEHFLKNDIKGISMIDIDEKNGLKACENLKKTYNCDSVLFIKADVSNNDQLESAFKETIDYFKNLDIVVNNAGIINEVDFDKCIDINFKGVIRGSYFAFDTYLPKYRQTDEAIIVNISSVVGIDSVEGIPTYCATKHGIIGLGKALGGDELYKLKKIRVLTVCQLKIFKICNLNR